jgi:hypothetical protein
VGKTRPSANPFVINVSTIMNRLNMRYRLAPLQSQDDVQFLEHLIGMKDFGIRETSFPFVDGK